VQHYISGLILNSKISFDPGNILELNGFSILGFFILALLTGFCFIVFYFAGEIIRSSFLSEQTKTRYTVFLVLLLIFAAIKFSFKETFPEFYFRDFAFLLALLLLTEIIIIRGKNFTVPASIIFLVLFSLYASVLVSDFNSRKQDQHLMALARRLESGRDHIAEYLFHDISPVLKADSVITDMLADKRNDLALLRLQQIYFSGYWSKYNVVLAVKNDTLPDAGVLTAQKLIIEKGDVTVSPELHFIKDKPENISYIARFSPGSDIEAYILFSEKLVQAETGFPELYLSGDAGTTHDLENFSLHATITAVSFRAMAAIHTVRAILLTTRKMNLNSTIEIHIVTWYINQALKRGLS
jgi:hypothetical protein